MIRAWVEVGKRKSFAGAVEWPGWARSGKKPEQALENLVAYGSRYASVMKKVEKLAIPRSVDELKVVAELQGNATTDFGAPGVQANFDSKSLLGSELERSVLVLKACWAEFDRSVKAATGKTLAKGPREGGRDVKKMVSHVEGAELDYLRGLGWTGIQKDVRGAFVDALNAKAAGDLPERGPRGGVRWPARFYVRRSAWHILDHAWELQDRIE